MAEKENKARKALEEGLRLFTEGKHQEALDAFNKAISLKEDDPLAWLLKGFALGNLGKHQEALDAFNKTISLKEDDPLAWNHKSIVLLRLKRLRESLTAVEKAISLNPEFHEAYDTQGTVLFHMEKWGESVEAYDKAIDLKPQEPRYWYNRGVSLSRLGRGEEAKAAWEQALHLNPRCAEAGQALQSVRGEGISWWDWWLVTGGRWRRGIAMFLMVLLAFYLTFPLFQEDLSWVLNLGKPWPYSIVPVATILFLLILPSIRRLFAVGGAGVEIQPLTPPPQPDLKPLLEMTREMPKGFK